jgi:hypothetical protein
LIARSLLATRGVLTFAGFCLILSLFGIALTTLLLTIAIATRLSWIRLIAALRLFLAST